MHAKKTTYLLGMCLASALAVSAEARELRNPVPIGNAEELWNTIETRLGGLTLEFGLVLGAVVGPLGAAWTAWALLGLPENLLATRERRDAV